MWTSASSDLSRVSLHRVRHDAHRSLDSMICFCASRCKVERESSAGGERCSPQVCEKVIYIFYISGRYRVAAWIWIGKMKKSAKARQKCALHFWYGSSGEPSERRTP